MSKASKDDSASDWDPSPHAISFETFGSANETRRPTIIVSHPTAPFEWALAAGQVWSENLIAQVAHAYLVRLHEWLEAQGRGGLGLPAGWLEALGPTNPSIYFGWLPVKPPFDKRPHPAGSSVGNSHRLLRRSSDGSSHDVTVILVAGERVPDKESWRPTRSGFGLRVVIHLRDHGDGSRANVNAMTAHLPYMPYVTFSELLDKLPLRIDTKALGEPPTFETLQRFLQPVSKRVAEAAHLLYTEDGAGPTFDEIRLIRVDAVKGEPDLGIEVAGVGLGLLASEGGRPTYRFTARLRVGYKTKRTDVVPPVPIVEITSRQLLISQGAPVGVPARVFEQDPASWREPRLAKRAPQNNLWYLARPTRDLDRFRIGRVVPSALESPCGDFRVRNCPDFVHSDPDNHGPRVVSPRPGGHDERSNDQSAIGAWHNCRDVFDVMCAFGLDPNLYFRACRRPVEVFYRSGISPSGLRRASDRSGRAINAWVKLQKSDAAGFVPEQMLGIEMHLALANFTRRRRNSDRPAEQRWAEPLGIAACERWMLHEFGHVLIAAVLGDLEFRFAHSLGDGLAAIWADPLSGLADPPDGERGRLRGYTFPWVFSSRRHDRCVLNGWSWSGTFQRSVTEAPEADLIRLKGYISEQVLSTTLFRLYRCLGGDTNKTDARAADIGRRAAASRVVLYLAMRALESFGHPPLRAEELEAAMIDADLGLTTRMTPDPEAAVRHAWVGGRAHKVIRWAFEAQGMHPPRPDVIHDAPGAPPPVDVYVKDLRSAKEITERGVVTYGPGGYPSVSLDWSAEAAWFADPAQVVGNRGDQPATAITRRFWVGVVSGNPQDDGWDAQENVSWLIETSTEMSDLAGHTSASLTQVPYVSTSIAEVEAKPPVGAREVLILLEVSSPDDRANTDPLAALPTAVASRADLPTRPRELADLVATDNNLGLWRRPLPPASA